MHKSFVKTLISLSFLFLFISKASAEGIWFPTDKPNCEVWNPQPQSEESALWSGVCLNGKAHGTGVTTWRNKKGGKFVLRLIEGERKNGRVIGQVTITYENGDVYIGKLNTNGNRDGQGTYVWLDGTKFEGGYKDGKYHGQGTFTFSHGEIQKGLWKDGKLAESDGGYGRKGYNFGFKTKWVKDKYAGIDFELRNCMGSYLNPFNKEFWTDCTGTHIFPGGNKYQGEFIGGKRHGKGVYTLANGNRYVGQYEFGKKNGLGEYTYYDGAIYMGYFKDDKRHGNGIYTQPKRTNNDGVVYIGDYKNGKKHGDGYLYWGGGYKYNGVFTNDKLTGYGTYTWPDGTKYVGDHKNDKQHGHGVLTYPNGDEYEGSFKDGKLTGQGTVNFSNGGLYVGDVKDNKLSGHGTYSYADGQKYVGSIKDSLKEGYGTHTAADGKKYVGQWKKNKLDGYATIYDKNGNIMQKGIFWDGVFVE